MFSLTQSKCLSVCESSVYLSHARTHVLNQLAEVLSIKEVALHMPFSSLVPDLISFSYYITIEKEHLWNKACLVLHGFPGLKSRCTTTTPLPQSFISLKSKCHRGPKSQGRLLWSFHKLSGCWQIMSCNCRQRPSEATHHSLPHGPFTTWQLASLRPPQSPFHCLLPLDSPIECSPD